MSAAASPMPAIVQPDLTLLLEVDNPAFEEARDALASFAELVKSPEHMHTYRISPLSLWNAAASGIQVDEVCAILKQYSRYDVPANVERDVRDYMSRYGRLRLESGGSDGGFILSADTALLMTELTHHKEVKPLLGEALSPTSCRFERGNRGKLKQALIRIGFPAQDVAGYTDGKALDLRLLATTKTGEGFSLREYQSAAASTFYASGGPLGGSGVVVLPCGAGKTVVGMATMAQVRAYTLILCPNIVAVRQWKRELLDRTTLTEEQIGEYSGEMKEIRPVTIATYQVLTYRKRKSEEFPHFELLNHPDWGLIVYDEVHLLPAPVFRATAELQARRRLGLTATLIREDGLETDVFSLIGPKKYDVPWKVLEGQGWIAPADCVEVRVPFPDPVRMAYAVADDREKFRLASENPEKELLLRRLLEMHDDDQVLIIGQYIDQLERIASRFSLPLLFGKTPTRQREQLYADFRERRIKKLLVSKVGNFAVDLPDARILIQISGTFGSRQEEAQRLGRVLRPKEDGRMAHFYTIVTADSKEQDYAANRQLFLVEQGYAYTIVNHDQILDGTFVPNEAVAGRM